VRATRKLAPAIAVLLVGALLCFAPPQDAFGAEEEAMSAGQKDYNSAVRHLKRRRFKRAIEAFEKALPHFNSSSDIFYNLVVACNGLRSHRKTVLYGTGFNYLEPASEDSGVVNEKVAKAQAALAKLGIKSSKISFEIKPKGAEITIDHVPVGTSGRSVIELYSGTHTVRASYYDHHTYEKVIEVKGAEPVVVKGTMEKIITHGTLVIATKPAKGVTIYVNNKKIGTTPVKPLTLRSGRHYIRFERQGWDRWHRYIEIENDLVVELKPVLERTPAGKSPYRLE
jgi:hypothetical protein